MSKSNKFSASYVRGSSRVREKQPYYLYQNAVETGLKNHLTTTNRQGKKHLTEVPFSLSAIPNH